MSEYLAQVKWKREGDEQFVDNKYCRAHEWSFDGGQTIRASSSPNIVPLPYSVADAVDPEEAFIASISSCHMLFFLFIAAKRRFVIDEYVDNAVGVVEKDESGRMAVTSVQLRPSINFSGEMQPTREDLEKMHNQSHEQCFIANSVKTKVVTEIIDKSG